MLSHQSLYMCEVSDPYPLHCLRYLEKHINTFFNYLWVFVVVYKHNLNVNLEGMGLVLGQSWMVVQINGRILFCPPSIMYCEVCCCLHIHSV